MVAKTEPTREDAVFDPDARPVAVLLAGAALMTIITQVSGQAAAAPQPSVSQPARAAAAAAPHRWVTIDKTRRGYVYTASSHHDSHLVVTRVQGGLRFLDTRANELTSRPHACRKRKVRVGIAAVCRVPARFTTRHPMKVAIAPRLGDDSVDASTLSSAFELSVLADAGRDVIRAGAGDDFVNGAQDGDRVSGGAGNDWIRTGLGNDAIRGGAGRDWLVGVAGRDRIRGGKGNDRLFGGPANDRLIAGTGRDYVSCSTGTDRARVDRADRTRDCESVEVG
jgi:serralysin